MPDFGQPLGDYRKPPVSLASWLGNQAPGDFFLEHQGQTVEIRNPAKPAQKQRRRDIVGQVGDDAPGRRSEGLNVRPEGVGLDDFEPPRIGRRQFPERRDAAAVLFDGQDLPCPRFQ